MKAISPFLLLTLHTLGIALGTNVDVTPDARWVNESIHRHNEFRRGFDSPPLKLNEKLCSSSLAFARELTRRGKLEHSDLGYGENIFVASGKNLEIYGSTPVDAWYDQIEEYFKSRNENDESLEADDPAIGSFTQVVWKGTTEMCIGYAASPIDAEGTGTVYIVAHYLPRGNEEDEEDENVTPLMSTPFFYKDSDSAPSRRHLSPPIGSNGKLIKHRPTVRDQSCVHSEIDATEVSTPSEFIEKALSLTNELRQRHSVPVLPKLDQESMICKSAQGWADTLANSSGASYEINGYDGDVPCEEMLHVSPELLKPEDLIRLWYKEGEAYEFDHHRTSTGSSPRNFVRLIWKGTEQFCIAYSKKKDANEYYYVGFLYQNPKPNYEDFEARKENVFSSASLTAGGLNFIIIFIGSLISILSF